MPMHYADIIKGCKNDNNKPKLQNLNLPVSGKKIFNEILPYRGMVAILVMWPKTY